jgi:hypothetical protein
MSHQVSTYEQIFRYEGNHFMHIHRIHSVLFLILNNENIANKFENYIPIQLLVLVATTKLHSFVFL